MYKLVLYITLNFFNVSINESHTIFGERKSHVQDPENCSMLSCIYWQIEIKSNLFICHIEILTLLHYLWLKNTSKKFILTTHPPERNFKLFQDIKAYIANIIFMMILFTFMSLRFLLKKIISKYICLIRVLILYIFVVKWAANLVPSSLLRWICI